jgi:hypothetical protein
MRIETYKEARERMMEGRNTNEQKRDIGRG